MSSSNPYIAGTIGAASVIGGAASAAMSADDKVAYLKALQNGETDLANSIAQKASGEQAQLSSLYSPQKATQKTRRTITTLQIMRISRNTI